MGFIIVTIRLGGHKSTKIHKNTVVIGVQPEGQFILNIIQR